MFGVLGCSTEVLQEFLFGEAYGFRILVCFEM